MAQSGAGVKKGKPSSRARATKSKRQPRSLGLTYAAVRHELKLTQPAMHRHLEQITSEYVFPAPAPRKTKGVHKSERRKRDEQRRRATLSLWEGPWGNPPFSVSHRYGVASRTYSGILDLTSLIYAELRDAGQSQDPREYLQRVEKLCAQIMNFSANVRRIVKTFYNIKPKYLLRIHPDDRTAYAQHLNLINVILDGFRGNGREPTH